MAKVITLGIVGYVTCLFEAWYGGYLFDQALVEPDQSTAIIYLGLAGYMLYLSADINRSTYGILMKGKQKWSK